MRAIKTMVFICALAVAAAVCRPAMAQSITDVVLGMSTSANGIVFSGGNGNNSLNVDIGGCPFSTSIACTNGGAVTGGLTVGGVGGLSYSLGADSLTASFAGVSNGVDTAWSLGGSSDFYNLMAGGSTVVAGFVDWTQLEQNSGVVSLIGVAHYQGEGALVGLGSGIKDIDVQLAGLSCNSDVTGPCTLGDVAGLDGDPPAAFSPVGSGTFSNLPPGATPEPGTLLLLGSGLLGFVPLIRRQFSA